MFKPVSHIAYTRLDDNKQFLVCTLSSPAADPQKVSRWRGRACAIFEFPPGALLVDVVRDLLANPQIRAIVFDGEGTTRGVFKAFWERQTPLKCAIREDHLNMVRQFVDLYDDDCSIIKLLPPYWPKRLLYLEKE